MTKNPSVSTANAPAFEIISSDDLSSASGGASSGGWDGNTGWAGGWDGNTGWAGGWDGNTGWAGGWRGNSGQDGGRHAQYYTSKRSDNRTNIARHTGYSLRDLLGMSPQDRKNPI